MNATGIIVEYNPLHNGHLYHIAKTKELCPDDVLIAVMSGDTVQRGDFAVCSKKARAAQAILAGVDLVMELPYPFCCESADLFAQGAVRVLSALHCGHVVFGSESNDILELQSLASKKAAQVRNTSMAASAQMQSNDILAVAYLKALRYTSIQPISIQRTNGYHDTTLHTTHVSAKAIRSAFYDGQDISCLTPLHEAMRTEALPSLASYYPFLQYCFQMMPRDYIASLHMAEEGIEQLFAKHAALGSYEDFVQACISKRYTRSRICRTLMHILLHTTKTEAQILHSTPCLRILAMNSKGRQFLNKQKKEGLQVASRFNQLPVLYQKKLLQICQLPNRENQANCIQEELAFPLFIDRT